MRVTVNDRPISAAAEDGDTLESLLDSLRSRGEIGSDEAVVEFRVDNRPWRGEDMDRLDSTRLADLAEVAINTDTMQGYARRILIDVRGMLSVLQEAVPCVAEQFRSSPPEEANDALFDLLNALQHFLICLYNVRNTCALEREPVGASGKLLDRVADCLDGIQSSQERKDWAALASRLEADLLPTLQGFETTLQDMIDEA